MSIRPQTVLERLRVKNFRSLADVDIRFDRLTVLVGANGSGKSTILDALRFGRDAFTRSLEEAILDHGGITSIRRWTARGAPDITFQFELRGGDWEADYSFVIAGDQRGSWRVKAERLRMEQDGRLHPLDRHAASPKRLALSYELRDGELHKLSSDLDRLAEQLPNLIASNRLLLPQLRALSFLTAPEELYLFFSGSRFYTLNPDELRLPQKPGNDAPLEERGQNMASVLQALQRDEEAYDLLNATLGRIVNGVTNYTVRPIGGFLVTRLQHEVSAAGQRGPAFELLQESDGTVRMLGILAALYQEPPRPLLTIEEPELTIHPGALGVLCDVIQEASARSQVIITTHSPDLIDRVPIDALRVVDIQDGVTRVGPVSSDQRDVVMRRLFSPSDLLRMEGLQREEPLKAGR